MTDTQIGHQGSPGEKTLTHCTNPVLFKTMLSFAACCRHIAVLVGIFRSLSVSVKTGGRNIDCIVSLIVHICASGFSVSAKSAQTF